MNKNDQSFIAQKIRSRYIPKEITELDELRALDRRVKNPANIFAYVFGTIGSLALGTGMCLAMEVIGDMMLPGILIGCIGIAMVSLNYSLHQKVLESRKKKYARQILELTEKLMNEN